MADDLRAPVTVSGRWARVGGNLGGSGFGWDPHCTLIPFFALEPSPPGVPPPRFDSRDPHDELAFTLDEPPIAFPRHCVPQSTFRLTALLIQISVVRSCSFGVGEGCGNDFCVSAPRTHGNANWRPRPGGKAAGEKLVHSTWSSHILA